MDKQVEALIQSCHPCLLVGSRPRREPLKSTPVPDKPWSELPVDLLEVPGGYHLLVAVDCYSRWIEASIMRKTDADRVIECLESMFRIHGTPVSIRSNNGPPFQSQRFSEFLTSMGIDHKKVIPLSPESNGEVERANSTILKAI